MKGLSIRCVVASALLLPASANAEPPASLWAACASDEPRQAIVACGEIIAANRSGEAAMAVLDRALAWRVLSIRLRAQNLAGEGAPESAALEAFADVQSALAYSLAAGRDSPAALTNRAVLYYEMGAYLSAIEDATQAIAIDPGIAEAWNIRALAHLKRGATAEATRDFDQTIRLEKNYGNAMIPRVVGPFVPDSSGGFARLKPSLPLAP